MPIRNRTVRVEDVFGSRDTFTDGQISDQYKRAVIRFRKGKVKNTLGSDLREACRDRRMISTKLMWSESGRRQELLDVGKLLS